MKKRKKLNAQAQRKSYEFKYALTEGVRPFLFLILIAFAVYAQTLFFGFTCMDDSALILDNYSFISKMSNLTEAFRRDVFFSPDANAIYYRPLMTVSLMFDAAIGGKNPFIYHLSNLIIHAFSSCLLFIFLIKIRMPRRISLLFSTIFVLHPVLSQAVSWIPGRNDSLLFMFLISAFIMFIDYLDSRKIAYYFAHMFLFLLSFYTKETAVSLIFICMLYSIFFKREKYFSREFMLLYAGWTAVCLMWFVSRQAALPSIMIYNYGRMLQNFVINLPATVLYLGKIILPVNLSVMPVITDSNLLYGLAVALALFYLIYASKEKNYRKLLFGAVWFLTFLLPSFITFNKYPVITIFDHRMYIPMIGLFIMIYEIDQVKKLDLKSKKIIGIAAAYLIALAAINVLYSRNFSGPMVFFQNAVKNSPNCISARINMGMQYFFAGDPDKAEQEYLECIKINANEPMVHNNLGNIYLFKGNAEKAEKEYLEELKIKPNYPKTWFNLGNLYSSQNRKKEAMDAYGKCIAANPDFKEAYRNMAILSAKAGDGANIKYLLDEYKKRGGVIDEDLIKSIEPFRYAR